MFKFKPTSSDSIQPFASVEVISPGLQPKKPSSEFGFATDPAVRDRILWFVQQVKSLENSVQGHTRLQPRKPSCLH